jgi:hypothetical protein
MLLRVQNIRVEAQHLRARCAMAEAKATGNTKLLAIATTSAQKIKKEKKPWAMAIAQLVDASVAAIRGDAGAVKMLDTAEHALTAADMHLYAAVVRYRRGQLVGGDEGKTLADTARGELEKLGAHNPHRIADMIMPGIGS